MFYGSMFLIPPAEHTEIDVTYASSDEKHHYGIPRRKGA